jgi:hypothetical protein
MRKSILTPFFVVLLAACAPSAPADYPRAASADDRWGVGVSFPVYESLEHCDDDPSVEKSLTTADMPTSRLGIRLNAGSAEVDAVRVANCVDQALSSGKVTILSPEEASQDPALPSTPPSPETNDGTGAAERSDCRESFTWPSSSTQLPALPTTSATAASCGPEPAPLTEEQMRGATAAPMPLQPQPDAERDSADSQAQSSNGEQREWTSERMRSASPAPMPSTP